MNFKKNKLYFLYILVFIALIYTRFSGLDWGLPYPMHPDERNIAVAIQGLSFSNLDPNFYAYGQFSIYLGFLVAKIFQFFDGDLNYLVSFSESILALRSISAAASVLSLFLLLKIGSFFNLKKYQKILLAFLYSFSIYSIQFAHFGTTESLLMLFYLVIIYYCFCLYKNNKTKYLFLKLGIVCGLSIATKISSIIFCFLPFGVVFYKAFCLKNQDKKILVKNIAIFIFAAAFFSIVFSPFNLIKFDEFYNSIRYESAVASGNVKVFYTRQFEDTVPIIFQFLYIFPYSLGFAHYFLFIIGFIFLPWKREFNLLRLAFLIYFIPTSFLYTKWTRFVAPILPICTLFAFLMLRKFNKLVILISCVIFLWFGISFLKIYQFADVRIQASEWINKNIKSGSRILSEDRNVVYTPLFGIDRYDVVDFNFYDLETNRYIRNQLQQNIITADYIIVPSRRIYANHKKNMYPQIAKYYEDLFSGKLGFKLIKTFDLGFSDEAAEETFTVFDHPVIRIYKKIKN